MKVYILCKVNEKYNSIYSVNKVFSNETEALKELYKKSYYFDYTNLGIYGYYDDHTLYPMEVDSNFIELCEKVYIFKEKFITKEIWDRVVEELPEKTTLNNLIKYDNEKKDYKSI